MTTLPPEPDRATGPPAAYRGLALLGLGIAGLVVVAVVVVLLAGDRDAPELDPGSPEAAVAAYLTAFDAGDLATAHAFFSDAVRDDWNLDAYRAAVDAYGAEPRSERGARRILFSSVDATDDAARVRLTVEEFVGEGLEGDVIRWDREVRMTREDGRWTIDEPLVWLDRVPTLIP